MFALHHPSNVDSQWSDYFPEELEFGLNYGPVGSLVRAGRVIYSLDARKQMARLISDFKPDIAHAHCIYHHLSPSVLGELRSRGVATVMTAHDLKLACPAYKMLNSTGICEKCKGGNLLNVARHRCIRNSAAASSLVMVESMIHRWFGLYRRNLDRIVVPSRFFGDKLEQWGWPRQKLVYIPNFVDADEFTPTPVHSNRFLFFGRLAPEKGVDTLIEAAVRANVELDIAGDGPEGEALKRLAEGHDNIRFLGRLEKNEVIEAVQNCRAMVLPSRWYENAPMSILESYALGRIVIGADVGGIPEMVKHDETGYLFEMDNVDELTQVLTKVSTTADAELTDMGQTACAWVKQDFSRQRYTDSMLSLYSDLGVGDSSRGSAA